MDYKDGIQAVIDYIEENITERITIEDLSKIAYFSPFYFQRVFYSVCGITVGEYIRERRLSLAGKDLADNDIKVIDVALKYCYETPESFSRAFSSFHGVSPSKVKLGSKYKFISPLSVKKQYGEIKKMDFRIEELDDFQVLVKKQKFTKNKEICGRDITAFWAQSVSDGTINRLIPYVNKNNIFKDSIIGISLEYKDGENDFPYGIGVHYGDKPITDKDFYLTTIPKSTFVVFPIKGRMPDVFRGVYEYLFNDFFPNSEYRPTGIEIEAYPSDDVQSDEYRWELWFSVEKK